MVLPPNIFGPLFVLSEGVQGRAGQGGREGKTPRESPQHPREDENFGRDDFGSTIQDGRECPTLNALGPSALDRGCSGTRMFSSPLGRESAKPFLVSTR